MLAAWLQGWKETLACLSAGWPSVCSSEISWQIWEELHRFFFLLCLFSGCFTEVFHGFQDVIQWFWWFLWRTHPYYTSLYFTVQSGTVAILYSLQFFSFCSFLMSLFQAVCQFLCQDTKTWQAACVFVRHGYVAPSQLFLGLIFYFTLWQCCSHSLVRFRHKTHLVKLRKRWP